MKLKMLKSMQGGLKKQYPTDTFAVIVNLCWSLEIGMQCYLKENYRTFYFFEFPLC